MKSVALFDLDNTLINGFSYKGLVRQHALEGLSDPSVVVASDRMFEDHKAGTTDYETTIANLLKLQAQSLRGQAYGDVLKSTMRFYEDNEDFHSFVPRIFDLLRDTHDLHLVTGEAQFVGEAVVKQFGLNGYKATEFEVIRGIFTGHVASLLANRGEKRDTTQDLLTTYGLRGSFAFGDSEGDIGMLGAVNYPICIDPNPGLEAYAQAHSWPIASPDTVLTVVETALAA